MIARRVKKLWQRMRDTFRNEPRELEFQTEMEEHLSLLVERYQRQGMTEEAALFAARQQFGNPALLKEDLRAMQIITVVEALRADLTYAARMLRKNPGFAAAAVITLALGIGANTTIFSVCNAVLFKPLPYAEPDRIVMLSEKERDGTLGNVSPANFVDWLDASHSFSGMAAMRASTFASSFVLGGQSEPSRLVGADVSSSFFSVLGVRFMLGRNFLSEEDRHGKSNVAILSYAAWSARFGADRDIAGNDHVERRELHSGRGVAGGFSVWDHGGRFPGARPSRHLGSARARSSKPAARRAYVARHRQAQARSETDAGSG
jgi:putative ABC transport system permease protein